MNCRKRAKSMIERIIKEINLSLENECYLSALGMALTLPDICGKAEYPNEKSTTKRYIEWFNTYVGSYEKFSGPYGDDMPYLSGEVLYNLRNSFLHQGTPNLCAGKIKNERCQIDDFILVIDDYTKSGHSHVAYDDKMNVSYKQLQVNLCNLCVRLSHVAEDYYKSNKNKFNFFRYTLKDNRIPKRNKEV